MSTTPLSPVESPSSSFHQELSISFDHPCSSKFLYRLTCSQRLKLSPSYLVPSLSTTSQNDVPSLLWYSPNCAIKPLLLHHVPRLIPQWAPFHGLGFSKTHHDKTTRKPTTPWIGFSHLRQPNLHTIQEIILKRSRLTQEQSSLPSVLTPAGSFLVTPLCVVALSPKRCQHSVVRENWCRN